MIKTSTVAIFSIIAIVGCTHPAVHRDCHIQSSLIVEPKYQETIQQVYTQVGSKVVGSNTECRQTRKGVSCYTTNREEGIYDYVPQKILIDLNAKERAFFYNECVANHPLTNSEKSATDGLTEHIPH